VAALCACGDADVLFLSTEGLTSLVLAEIDGERVELSAYDTTTALRPSRPASGQLYVLGYPTPLDALGLTPGPLTLDPAGVALPTPTARHRLDASAWTPLAADPEFVRTTRISYVQRCARFRTRVFAVPTPPGDEVSVALPLDERRVLVGTRTGLAFEVTTDDMTPYTRLSTTTLFAGGLNAGDELWLADAEVIRRGHPERGFTSLPRLPTPLVGQIVLDVSREGEPFELFAVDTSLRAMHFDGARWTELRAPSPQAARVRPGVVRLGPGRAAMIGTGTSTVIELSVDAAERARVLALPSRPASPDTVWSLAYVPGLGPLLGTRYAVIYRWDAGTWTALPLSSTTPRADVFFALDAAGHFMAGGQDGLFVQRLSTGEICEPSQASGSDGARAIAPLGSGYVLASVDGSGRSSVILAERAR
jgi:hypothetical protein